MTVTEDRTLHWDGCSNVRDLGGLPCEGGRRTRHGAVVRSDHPSKLSTAGWKAVVDHGVRSVIELRTAGADEDKPDRTARPKQLATISMSIEDLQDAEFKKRWVDTQLWNTPLYYCDALARWQKQHCQVLAAFAQAPPGAVLIHCGRGHDRTGIICLLLLALAEVEPEAIADDYALSDANMPAKDREHLKQTMDEQGTTIQAAILKALRSIEIETYLREGGLSEAIIRAARRRLF